MKSMVTLSLILVAIIPLSSVADCTLNGVVVVGDPELIEGTNGPDNIDCSTSSTRHDIYGYGGNDILIGSDYDDFIAGGGGIDEIHGGEGHDAIDGGANDDVIHGEGGNDIIFGGVGSAPASGVGCVLKTAFIAAGSSYLTKGGSGDDTIYGGDGNDCIEAGSGEDLVYGEDGNDTLEGGNHSDMLDGGSGDDHLDGGWHTDSCIGGGGNDDYVNCESIEDLPPSCGDSNCDIGEDRCSCMGDCGEPTADEASCTDSVDNDCDSDIDCDDADCSSDPSCSSFPACDNDGICEPGEDCTNCSNDCAGKSKGKPSGRYCCGDGTAQPEEDSAICDGNI